MSAAAVISIRRRRIFEFLRQRQALSADTAVQESDVPYSDRWYYHRLVAYGAIRQTNDKCYLDEQMVQQYLLDRRKRAFVFFAVVAALTILYVLISTLLR